MDSTESVIFCQDGFMSQSFAVFEEMRQNKELVDFTITLENRCIVGHRLVLAARIPHFRVIFRNAEEKVSLHEVDPDALELVINFAYSGRIRITPENVQSLLSASKMLQLSRLYDACWEFVVKRLHPSSVLEIRKIAEDHRCPEYLDLVDNYIRQNFEQFINSESFLTFPFRELKELISRDDIKVDNEEKVFEAVIRWVKGSPSNRDEQLPELLGCVRMYYMTPEYLIERVSAEKLIQTSIPCRDLVDEAKSFHLLRHKKSKFGRFPPQPRMCQIQGFPSSDPALSALYAVCYSGYEVILKMFSPTNNTWSNRSKFSVRDGEAVTELNGIIYVFGTVNIFTYDVKSEEWSTLYDVGDQNVSCSGFVPFNNQIYFFGGTGNYSCKVRSFDPSGKAWFDVGNMRRHLHNPGVTSLREFIYMTGGVFAGKISKAVELYNSEKKTWNELPPMNSGRYAHGCCSLNEKVYVCGGFLDERTVLKSAEVYHPKTSQWNDIALMTEPIYKLSMVSCSGKLCAIGRRNKHSLRAANIEIYDPNSNKWTDDVAVPNAKDYTIYLVSSDIR